MEFLFLIMLRNQTKIQSKYILFMKTYILKSQLFVFLFFLKALAFAQQINGEVGLSSGYTSNNAVPFWYYANRQGDVPMSGFANLLSAKIEKKYLHVDSLNSKFDWSFSVDGRLRTGDKVDFRLIEGKIGAKYSIFEFVAGRERERSFFVDSSLSTGSFSLSGNSLGIPKIELRIPQYYSIPGTKGLLAVKGRILNGWMGKSPIHYGENRGANVETYYHHLAAYGRLGKPHWKLKLEAGVTHDVIWGSDKFIFGDQYDLNALEGFYYVLTGKAYKGPKNFTGSSFDISKIGNHLGTIDLAATYDFSNFKLNLYRQFFYDKGALRYAANIKDGLTGIKLVNKKPKNGDFHFNKLVFEYFYSKDQGGQYGAPWTPSGPEYYYNHGVYAEGFSYKGLGIGTPLIMPAHLARENLPLNPKDYFVSSRVSAFHLGIIGDIAQNMVTGKITVAKHFGDYHTSGPDFQWFNGKQVAQNFKYGIFEPVNQVSYFLEVKRPLKNQFNVSISIAGDQGKLLNNTFGGFVSINKFW